jgi:hypothetical protein
MFMLFGHEEASEMKHVRGIAIVSLASALVAGALAGADQHSGSPAGMVSRYTGVANVAAPAGKAATPLKVEIKDWSLVRTGEGVRLPATGFYIVQLKSGRIDTEIAGKKEHRHPGEFWTVAASESMTVSFPPHSEAAQLQTIAVNPGARTR